MFMYLPTFFKVIVIIKFKQCFQDRLEVEINPELKRRRDEDKGNKYY